MVYRLIKSQEQEPKEPFFYFYCRYNNLEIDHPLVATFLLPLSRTACLCFLVKVEPRSPMTCLSSIFWIRGKSNEKILQITDKQFGSKLQSYTDRITFFKVYQICFNVTGDRKIKILGLFGTSAVFPVIFPPEFPFHFKYQ